MAATVFTGIADLSSRVGSHLGYSGWRTVSQEQVDRFADATDDHQWIHVDVERAKEGPFGQTIAHGYLTLALAAPMTAEIFRVDGTTLVVNYGLNKVRFPAPVPVGSRLRLGAHLADVEDVPGGAQALVEGTFEIERGTKPACVAELLFRYYV